MSASLVGSEMCIRDRAPLCRGSAQDRREAPVLRMIRKETGGFPTALVETVSYTHLTLPTICSV
eukprot:623179-Alexandrium_andersonii.AAC.1